MKENKQLKFKAMKKYYSNNEALNEMLVENGINLIVNEKMEITVSDEDALRIKDLVEKFAPAAVQDYSITMELYALANSVWHADDYLNDRNTNPMCTDLYLFATEEEAKDFAINSLSYDDDIYNDGTIYSADIAEEDILEATGFESMEDFNEALAEPYSTEPRKKNFGEDEKAAVAQLVMDEDGCGIPCDCANYDFGKSLEGAILVMWSWQTYVGYARKCEGLRYGYSDDTEELLTKQDRVFAGQVDVVMTAEEVEASEDLQNDLTERLLQKRDWKWTNPDFVEFSIETI